MSTIAAGTTTGTALVSTGDTSGQLVLQTNGTTTAVTIGTNQVVTLAQPLPAASGGTGAASLTANNVLLGNGTSAVQFVAPGANGNVLTSNGTTWASSTPATGAMVYISTTTASSSSTIDITGLDSTYACYMVFIDNLRPGSGSVDFQALIQYNGTWQSGGGLFKYALLTSPSSGLSEINGNQYTLGQSFISSTSKMAAYCVNIPNPSATGVSKCLYWNGTYVSDDDYGRSAVGGGTWTGGTSLGVTGVRFKFSGGNIATGNFRLYGVKPS